ncbi:helix-turn-helix domain-containing protein [Duganella sp. FT134W]|uniref:Helix-turn-helix domain-containing protein n=1 Tax=Duganella margarita TaxID=2692170 RepID=A0A7X4H854_9BURK|nr:helix-turn-helix transcriptional regulator [Duganella margarita]MYM76067.1 helix-turn-helix domain-containing protein [Duganella margarita]
MARVSVKTDKDSSLVRLGAAIRARRQLLSMSQEALADHAGIDRSHMGKVERGERNITLLNIMRIAIALDCSASELLSQAGL